MSQSKLTLLLRDLKDVFGKHELARPENDPLPSVEDPPGGRTCRKITRIVRQAHYLVPR